MIIVKNIITGDRSAMIKRKRRKRLIRTAIILSLLLAVYFILALLPSRQCYAGDNPLMRAEGEMPILIAHRGGDEEFPGNTLEAFYNAYSVDERVIMETDGCLTKDGVLILSHNTTLDKYTNATGAVSDWTYTDLLRERVDFGYVNRVDEDDRLIGEPEHFSIDGVDIYPTDVSYPDGVSPRDDEIFLVTTFEELLTSFPENKISIEIKQDGELGISAFEEAMRLIEKHDAFDRVIVASFHSEIFRMSKEWDKGGLAPEGFMYSPGLMGIVKFYAIYAVGLDNLYGDGVAVLQLPTDKLGINFASERLIRAAHEHNIAVHYWTVNDEDDMRRLIELGADGIMTDCPSKLKAVYESMK